MGAELSLRAGRGWPMWAAVVAIHLIAVLALVVHRQSSLDALRAQANPPVTSVTLRLRAAATGPAPRHEPQERRQPSMPPIGLQPLPVPEVMIQTDPAPVRTVSPASPSTAMRMEPAASAPVRPLDLSLPPGAAQPGSASMAARATQDPRTNSARRSLEDRIATATGGPPASEERLSGTRRRFRDGRGGCIEVEESRVAQNNPMDPRWRDMPGLVSKCQ